MALESINSKDEEEKARIQRLGALEDLQAKERQLRDLIDEVSIFSNAELFPFGSSPFITFGYCRILHMMKTLVICKD